MAKTKVSDSGLFGGINMDDFENTLITVDDPDEGELQEQLKDQSKEKIKTDGEEINPDGAKKIVADKKVKEVIDDSIIVDEPVIEKHGEEKEKIKKPNEGGAPDEGNDSPVYLHAAALQENGVLPDFDLKELKDLDPGQSILKINEHIQKQINTSIEEGIEEYKSTVGDKALEFIESLEKGIPFEDLAENYSLDQKYGSIKTKDLEDNEELQEQVYSDLLTMRGFSEAKVKKMV